VAPSLDLRPEDTSPEAWEEQLAAYRQMGGPERTAIAFRLTDMARRMAEAGIRERHPDYGAGQVQRALLRLRLGDEAARQVWPDQQLVEP
jgi:hypothetical protein